MTHEIALDCVTETINAATAALRDETGNLSDPESLWEAIDNLGTELVRVGYEKPKKPHDRPTFRLVVNKPDEKT